MTTAAIICEYNPFHNGHKYHIEYTKNALNAECVICLMSGNFVQRGEPAVFDMHIRADAAIKNGADLVLEIPPQFVLRSAQHYAYFGIYILKMLGNIDYLSFGSECGNIAELEACTFDEKKFRNDIKLGKTYGAVINSSPVLRTPNNILGYEYIKAIKELEAPIKPFTFKREGAMHSDTVPIGNISSATYVRNIIKEKGNYKEFVPYDFENSKIHSEKNAGLLLSYKLKSSDSEIIRDYMNISEGLENRFLKFSHLTQIEDYVKNIYCKRYISTRIRRAAYSILFSLKKDEEMPSYTRVLALNDKGKKYLNSIKKSAEIKIYSKITKKDIFNNHQLAKELKINEMYDTFF